ncbi:BatA domain-containing protein [Limibacter armeniacum]|uniref:BatA domain-containing protein n=1 Tax=Limibacter armeniacum TaxID=466084 RepID=UPI002FE61838
MNFLFPAFLYGLSLAAIPVIIHFFNFQRARKVYFTNVAFLKSVKDVTNSRNKLKNLLVMMARILFIVFLVMAFARPFIPNENSMALTGNANYVSVYFDNSYSMENEQDGRRLFDMGRSQVEQISKVFPNTAVYQLLDNGFESGSGFFYEQNKMEEKLLSVGFSNFGRNLKDVYEKQQTAFRTHSPSESNHIFWVSDFQRSSVGDLSRIQLDSTNRLYLMPLKPSSDANLYIDSVWLSSPFIRENENNTLNVTLANDGDDNAEGKLVKLFLGDRQVSSASVSIAGKSSETVEMTFAVTESGDQPCRISVEDYPVSFDNDYFFVIKVAPKIRIVVISDLPDGFLESVYSSETFFEVKSFSTKAIDYSELTKADLIILDQLPTINDALSSAITAATQGGTNVTVFPAVDANLKSYSGALGIPMRKVQQAGTPSEKQQIAIQVPARENPFFDGVFEKISANMSMPKAIAGVQWTVMGNNLLYFKTGELFLSEVPRQNHKIYMFASPLTDAYTNFPKHALFVPVMYKVAISSKMRSDHLSYSFGDPVAAVNMEELNKADVYKLVKGEFELIPPQKVAGNMLLMDIPKSGLESGCYDIKRAQDGQLMGRVAFNYNKKESELNCYSSTELAQIFKGNKNVQIYNEVGEDQFVKEFRDNNVAKPLWRYFLIVALLALTAELLMLRFWNSGAKKRQTV